MNGRHRLRGVVICSLCAFVGLARGHAEQGTDAGARKIFAAARAYINEETWAQATKLLQVLLDRGEDSKVEVTRPGPDGKPVIVIVSTWSEAERVIQSLPAAGFAFYQKEYEPVAAQLLKEAKAFKADDLLAEAARRFRYTKSGTEAAESLAMSSVDAGKPKEAVPHFERLLGWPGPEKLHPLILYRAALAFRQLGDKSRSEEVWKHLEKRVGPDGLRVGDRTLSLQELRMELKKDPK